MKTDPKEKTVAEAIENFTKSIEALAGDVREKLTDPAPETPAAEVEKGAEAEAPAVDPAPEVPAVDTEKDAEIETLKARIAELEAAEKPADTDKSFDIDAAEISINISEKKKGVIPDETPPAMELEIDDSDPAIGLTKAFSGVIFS